MTTTRCEHQLDFFIEWLLQKVAEIIGKPIAEIDEKISLFHYGFDSLQAVMLYGEIEQWMNLELEPTIAWDYPTVFEMAKFLHTKQQEVATQFA